MRVGITLEDGKGVESKFFIHINNDVAWNISEKLSQLILKELKSGLDDEFKDRFDAHIQSAIDTIESFTRLEEWGFIPSLFFNIFCILLCFER